MKAILIRIVLAACAWFGYKAFTPQAPPVNGGNADVRTGDWMRVLMQDANTALSGPLSQGVKSVEDLQSRILAVDTEKQSLTDDTPRSQWIAARKKRILQQWEPVQKRIVQDLKMAEDRLLKSLPDDMLIKADDSLIHLRDELDSLLIARPAQAPLPGNP